VNQKPSVNKSQSIDGLCGFGFVQQALHKLSQRLRLGYQKLIKRKSTKTITTQG
jgi:hypothetical protein